MSDIEKSAAPEVDSIGLKLTGEVKTIYKVVAMGHEVQLDGAILVQAKTECGRTISCLKELAYEEKPVLYGVNVSQPNSTETERAYFGGEGSDACRVFNGYLAAWEKCKPNGS